MKIKIFYEDSNILAIDKPSGILVHPDLKNEDKTILDLFIKKYPKVEVVHRLDRDTSGVMLLAKNAKAHEFLKKQFMDRSIKKTYHAIVSGFVKNEHATINKPIGRSPKDFRRHLAGRGVRGELREAITEYRVLKRLEIKPVDIQNFSSCALPRVRGGTLRDKNFKYPQALTYLEIHPKTGRTHQIRVHMKFINHPVVCDSLYNLEGACPDGLNRLALHAKSIEFKDLKGKIIKVESPLPKEFEKILN
jgi:23S rRNA pseudouridine1911/1915/1917 synthase